MHTTCRETAQRARPGFPAPNAPVSQPAETESKAHPTPPDTKHSLTTSYIAELLVAGAAVQHQRRRGLGRDGLFLLVAPLDLEEQGALLDAQRLHLKLADDASAFTLPHLVMREVSEVK